MLKSRSLKTQCYVIPGKRGKRTKFFPQLTLRGRWLEEAGFPPDYFVEVHVQDGRLIIEPAAGLCTV